MTTEVVAFKKFNPDEHLTWKLLFEKQSKLRSVQIYEIFDRGIDLLGFTPAHIPELSSVNAKLNKLTGFEGVPVAGLEEYENFFKLLAKRKFPIGNFIRNKEDLSYTPAPDVFHDLYGHIPFFSDSNYASYCTEFGKRAAKYAGNATILTQFSRLFWFTNEFALIKTPNGKRIFGAGITSSFGECAYALSDDPEVRPFDLERIRNHDFRIDEFQKVLYILENERDLYTCLDAFEAGLPKNSP